MENPFKELPPRQIHLLAITLFVFTILASYLYLFKKPLANYQALRQSRILLAANLANGGHLADELKRQEEIVAKLTKNLRGAGQALPAAKLISHNIDQLDQLSNRHALRLESVKPENPRPGGIFEEIPLTIRVSGSYFNLYQWLHEVEKELHPMVVKQFDLGPGPSANALTMNLRMVSYIALENN